MKTPHWPHAPVHRLSTVGTYFVTVGTYAKEHHFREAVRLDVLTRGLLQLADTYGWQIEAWAVFSNHYHFVAHSPDNPATLRTMLGTLHRETAKWVNQLDQAPGRKVWHNFRDTRLTFEKSYLARLHYVHHNPVHHGLVPRANAYPWCSAGWFERTATPAQVSTIYSMPVDQLKIEDPYEPLVPDA